VAVSGHLQLRHFRPLDEAAALAAHCSLQQEPEIFRQALVVARAVGVDEVLLVCNASNVGSARTIEACGGKLESVIPGPDGSEPQRRYWIS